MTTTKSLHHVDLAERIERLVREYISTIRIAAEVAVERAVGASAIGSTTAMASAKQRAPSPARRGMRRPSDEIGALSERLYEAVSQAPGETMIVIAPMIGATARELSRPMLLLRQAGRIRSVGRKHATRYFPMASGAPRASA
jgi:hypothetical protein